MILGSSVGERATECLESYRQAVCRTSLLNGFQTGRGVGAGWHLREGCNNAVKAGPKPAIRKARTDTSLERLQLTEFNESHTLKAGRLAAFKYYHCHFGSNIKFAKSM